MSGFVYAIAAGDRVKIGWSSDPLKRLTKVQSDCPETVTLLGIVPATVEQEKELHTLLTPWRVAGEWFRCEGVVAALVSMLPQPAPKSVRELDASESAHPLRRWRRKNRQTLRMLAGKVGCTYVHLSRIECGFHLPSVALMRRIKQVTGLTADEFVEAAKC